MKKVLGVVLLLVVLATIVGPLAADTASAVPPLLAECCERGNPGCCGLYLIILGWEEHWYPWWNY